MSETDETKTPDARSLHPAGSAYEVIVILFRDIHDVVNRRPRTRTFQTRAFLVGDKEAEAAAVKQMWAKARKHGMTENEIIRAKRRPFVTPNGDISDRAEKGGRS